MHKSWHKPGLYLRNVYLKGEAHSSSPMVVFARLKMVISELNILFVPKFMHITVQETNFKKTNWEKVGTNLVCITRWLFEGKGESHSIPPTVVFAPLKMVISALKIVFVLNYMHITVQETNFKKTNKALKLCEVTLIKYLCPTNFLIIFQILILWTKIYTTS